MSEGTVVQTLEPLVDAKVLLDEFDTDKAFASTIIPSVVGAAQKTIVYSVLVEVLVPRRKEVVLAVELKAFVDLALWVVGSHQDLSYRVFVCHGDNVWSYVKSIGIGVGVSMCPMCFRMHSRFLTCNLPTRAIFPCCL